MPGGRGSLPVTLALKNGDKEFWLTRLTIWQVLCLSKRLWHCLQEQDVRAMEDDSCQQPWGYVHTCADTHTYKHAYKRARLTQTHEENNFRKTKFISEIEYHSYNIKKQDFFL